ncbi:MAG: preprotein translocase subunit SecE [Eubacteriales bacterium]|nr:preprotein translocase subunit SecE [Eubacteriales bacterium]
MGNDKKVAATAAAKPEKQKKKKKGPNKFIGFFKKIGQYFREVVGELKKVTWPSRKDFLTYSLAVFVFVVIMMVIVFAMDTGLTTLLNKLLGA